MIKRLLKDTAIYGMGDVASRLVALLLLPFYTRLLDVADFGRLDLLIVLSMVLGIVSGMRLTGGVGRGYYDARCAGRHRQLAGTGLILRLFSTTGLILVVAGVYSLFFQEFEGIGWAHVVPLLAMLHPAQLVDYSMFLLRLERRPRLYGLIVLGEIASRTLMSLAAITLFDGGVAGVLWAFVVSKAIWAVVALFASRQYIAMTFDRGCVREMLSFSLPGVPSVFGVWLQRHGNRFLMLGYLTMADVGVYSLAMKIAAIAMVFDTAFRVAWWPMSMEMIGTPGASARFARVMEYYVIAMFGIYSAISCLAFLLIKTLTTDAYLTAAWFVAPIAMGHLWDGLRLLGAMGLKISRRTVWISLVSMFSTLINLSLLAATVERFGLAAAGMTYLIGNVVGALLMVAVSQRKHRLPYRKRIFAVALVATLLLPLLLGLLPMPTGDLVAFSTDALVRLVVAGSLWIGATCLLLRAEDRVKLWRRLRWAQGEYPNVAKHHSPGTSAQPRQPG